MHKKDKKKFKKILDHNTVVGTKSVRSSIKTIEELDIKIQMKNLGYA